METLQVLEKTAVETMAALKSINDEINAVTKAIIDARNALAESDYKRGKNIEYTEVGLPLPYSWADIHAEAQPLRDTINEFEPKIEPLKEQRKILIEEMKIANRAYRERLQLLNLPPYEKKEETIEREIIEEGENWSFENNNS